MRRGYMDSTKLERAILCGSEHPFIVRLRFAFQNGAKLYLVTDFYNGGNLLVHLKRNCGFPEYGARFFAAEVFLAIEYLHRRRIVYRDLKVRASWSWVVWPAVLYMCGWICLSWRCRCEGPALLHASLAHAPQHPPPPPPPHHTSPRTC